MPCSCGSTTCNCTPRCQCTAVICTCISCLAIRGIRCEDCGFPHYYPFYLPETSDWCRCHVKCNLLEQTKSNDYANPCSIEKGMIRLGNQMLHSLELASRTLMLRSQDNSSLQEQNFYSILDTDNEIGSSDPSSSVTDVVQMTQGTASINDTSPENRSLPHVAEDFCSINVQKTNKEFSLDDNVDPIKDIFNLPATDSNSSSIEVISETPSKAKSDEDSKACELKSELVETETELQNPLEHTRLRFIPFGHNLLPSEEIASSILDTILGSGSTDDSNSLSVKDVGQVTQVEELIKQTSPDKLSSPKHASEEFCINLPETIQKVSIDKVSSKKDISDKVASTYMTDNASSSETKYAQMTKETEFIKLSSIDNPSFAQHAPGGLSISTLPEAEKHKGSGRRKSFEEDCLSKHTSDSSSSSFEFISDCYVRLSNESSSDEA